MNLIDELKDCLTTQGGITDPQLLNTLSTELTRVYLNFQQSQHCVAFDGDSPANVASVINSTIGSGSRVVSISMVSTSNDNLSGVVVFTQ